MSTTHGLHNSTTVDGPKPARVYGIYKAPLFHLSNNARLPTPPALIPSHITSQNRCPRTIGSVMAAEEANPFPFMVPNEVSENYEVPQDKAGVVGNDELAECYSLLGEHINHTSRLNSDSFFGENCSSQIDEMKAIIKNITIEAHEKIGHVGDNAFPLPEELVDALKYLDIPWPPVL